MAEAKKESSIGKTVAKGACVVLGVSAVVAVVRAVAKEYDSVVDKYNDLVDKHNELVDWVQERDFYDYKKQKTKEEVKQEAAKLLSEEVMEDGSVYFEKRDPVSGFTLCGIHSKGEKSKEVEPDPEPDFKIHIADDNDSQNEVS